jgi:hypothetical protein
LGTVSHISCGVPWVVDLANESVEESSMKRKAEAKEVDIKISY